MEILSNQTVSGVFEDAYNVFWRRWRDRAPNPESEEWERVVTELEQLKEKYGYDERADEIFHWILERLDERSKAFARKGGV